MQTTGTQSPRPMGDMRAGFAQTWEGFLPPGAIVMAKKPATQAHAQPLQSTSASHVTEVPFFFFTGAITNDETALFQKITQALGLTPELYLSGTDLPMNIRPAVCVRFGGGVTGEWSELEVMGAHVPLFSTHGLSELAVDLSLKKDTWNHLKSVCDRIGFAVPKR